MAAITQLIPTATPGRRYGSFAGKTAGVVISWTSYGGLFEYLDSQFGYLTITLKVCMYQTTGTAYARLYDTTDAAAVADSEISTTSGTAVVVESDPLALEDGHLYQVQFGTEAGDAGAFYSAHLAVT